MPTLSLIIPCYFNEENLPDTTQALIKNEALFPQDLLFEYVFVDDGSKDNTLGELLKFYHRHPDKVKVIKLASNVGSYNAILAGMTYATGNVNVILTADLQDPVELIPKMYDYWTKGIKFVIANRSDREESLTQRLFSNTYHYLMKKIAIQNIPLGGFDLVLFDRELKDHVVKINEKNTNTIYLLSWLGYDYVNIPYVRRSRRKGRSRWTFGKKLKLFIDSFTAFSFTPIRILSFLGLLLGFAALLYAAFVVVCKFTGLLPVRGWPSLIVVLLVVSSFQMIGLGIIGEYLWRTLDAARGRPNFVVDKIYTPSGTKE